MSVDDTRFLAWAAPTIGEPRGSEGGRRCAAVPLTATVTGRPEPITGGPEVLLAGPADVSAIARSAIRRVRPPAGRTEADGEYFASIDFDDADLPWRYGPEHPAADDAMVPWLVLVAGREGSEVGMDAAGRGWVSSGVTAELPLADARLWSHVHERLGPTGWRLEASRLLCPRALPDDADCLAMLVPRFREGAGGLVDAWQPGRRALGLPVLHSWRFRTNAAGTFTSLARALAPMTNPPGLGTASVSIATDTGVERATAHGPLAPLEAPDPGGWNDAAAVDRAVDALLGSSTGGAGAPVLGPPRYASRWLPDVESTAWGRELSRDPRHRGVAALGVQAGIDWQEQIVEAASRRIGSTHLAAGMLGHLTAAVALTERLLARRPGGAGAAGAAHAADRLGFYGPALRKVRATGGRSALELLGAELAPLRSLMPATSVRRLARAGRRPVPGLAAPTGVADAIALANGCRPPAEAPLEPAVSGHDRGDLLTASIERLFAELGDEAAHAEFGGSPFEADVSSVRPRRPEPERECSPVALESFVDVLDDAFDPRGAMVEAVLERIRPRPQRFDVPLRIAPDLDLPAWAWLRDRAPQWLLPRSGLIPPDRVVALRTNGAFIEAFLVGLSQQAAAELVWRGVPLSPAAVPMRTLWQRLRDDPDDPVVRPDIAAVQDWDPAQPLGDPARHDAVHDDLLVIAMRSEILRRYPETVIRLVPKRLPGGEPDTASPGVSPLAVGMITPGLWCIVFDVPPEDVTKHFLVLEETIDGPRFAPRPEGAQDSIDHPLFGPSPPDATNGATFAARHWARPVRALIDGDRFARPDEEG